MRRLQGKVRELADQVRLLADVIGSEEIDSEVGQKRTFRSKNADNRRDQLMPYLFKMNGIVSIYQHASRTSLDKTVSHSTHKLLTND